MNIAITGATGLIGKALLNKLSCEPNYNITALARTLVAQQELYGLPNVRWIKGDLRSESDCKVLLKDKDVIVHLAHTNSPLTSEKDVVSDASLNLIPTLTLLKAVKNRRPRLHFIFASSGGAIYGGSKNKMLFKESDICLPDTSYGIQKLTAELYLRVYAQRHLLSAVILRIANAYGQILNPERLQGLIGASAYNLLKGYPIRLIGNPDNVRDYIHLDDIVNAIKMSIHYRKDFSVLNIGSGIGYSVKEVIDHFEKVLGHPVRRIQDKSLSGNYLTNWCVLDIKRAKKELNWEPKIDLKSGIYMLLKEIGMIPLNKRFC
jgi:UDP-glucose 4-epimerase